MDGPGPDVPPDAIALGERVYLRFPAEPDREAFSRLVASSHAHLARWVSDPVAQGDPEGTRWFTSYLEANLDVRNRKLFVHRIRDGELLGCMNINEIVRGAFQSAFLGYWIGAAYEGRGYMSDALGAVLRYAFASEGLHRVEANIQPGNDASIALVRKAGFRREGFSPRYLKVGGTWCDHERWAFTVEDWREALLKLDRTLEGPPMTPRLIALDLDGTLLDDDLRIRARARRAVARAQAAGAVVALCTGRPPRMTHAYAEELRLAVAIVYNGASRYRYPEREGVHHHQLTAARAREVVARLREEAAGVLLGLETPTGWYLDAATYEAARERLARAGLPPPDGVGPVENFLDRGAIKVFARHAQRSVGALAECVRDLDVYATWSGPGLLEVMHPDVNKRDALERLAGELGIARRQVAAFGDNHNDLEMLAWAGHGVATANGSESARAAADEVTASNVEDGVAVVLERWFGTA